MNLNIAITGLNATDNPAPGIPVARCLREANWKGKIIGLAYDAFDTGIYDKEILDEVYLIPYPNEGEIAILDRLKQISHKTKIDIFIPTLDSELFNANRIANELKNFGIHTFLPSEEQIKMRSKSLLSEFCMKHNIPVPKTQIVNDIRQLQNAVAQLKLPIVVKGVFYEAYVCHSLEEAIIYFGKINIKWGLPIIVQEFLNGEEYDVACVGDGFGNLVGKVPMRKLRLTDKGKAWAGITIYDKVLDQISEHIISALKWRGPCELEFLKEQKSGKYVLIEINPRFPSWIYLSAGVNVNLPFANVKLAIGKKVKEMTSAKAGFTFVRHAIDLVCPMNYIESLTIKGELIFKK